MIVFGACLLSLGIWLGSIITEAALKTGSVTLLIILLALFSAPFVLSGLQLIFIRGVDIDVGSSSVITWYGVTASLFRVRLRRSRLGDLAEFVIRERRTGGLGHKQTFWQVCLKTPRRVVVVLRHVRSAAEAMQKQHEFASMLQAERERRM